MFETSRTGRVLSESGEEAGNRWLEEDKRERERVFCFSCTKLEMTAKGVSEKHALILPYEGNFLGKRGLE